MMRRRIVYIYKCMYMFLTRFLLRIFILCYSVSHTVPCGVASSPQFFYYFLAVTITSKEPTLGWLLKWKKFIQDILERNEICWMNWCRRNNLLCYNELTCVYVYIGIYVMYVLRVYGGGVSKDLRCKDSFYLSWYYNFTHNQCKLHVPAEDMVNALLWCCCSVVKCAANLRLKHDQRYRPQRWW